MGIMAKDDETNGSEDSGIKGLMKMVVSSISRPPSISEKRLKRDASKGSNMALSDQVPSATGSTHGCGDGDEEPKARNSNDSAAMVAKLSHIPINLRGRAEKWEIPRSEVQLLKKIGEGQGGIVYKCRWRSLDCAAKLLNQDSKNSIAYFDMINEITIISHLRHPNLVLFLGACTVGNEPLVIVSEYMAGGSLEDRFKIMCKDGKGQPAHWAPPVKLAVRWIMDLSRAVCFLHNCTTPIIHRDLKPANLLLTEEDHLKVSDFGLCKTLQKVNEDGTPYQMTGNTGTRRYMAPEVVLCNPKYDEKVDIYSMAMIFWYIFMGVRPFEGVQPDLVAELTSQRGMRPPLEGLGWPAMESLIEKMWAGASADRPSASQILNDLGTMTAPASLLARDAEQERRRSKSTGPTGCAANCVCM